tara:strand:- start:5641 stop:6216 length:576 start_codon:yes stop_codon:yes gene_type:complete
MSILNNLTKLIGGNKAAGTGLGLLGLSGIASLPQFAFSKSTMNRMSNQLEPMRQSLGEMRNMAQQYMDPNSALNEQMRASIRGKELTALNDIVARNIAQSTGTYGTETGQMMNQNLMSDAISKALGNYSAQQAGRVAQGTQLMGQSANLATALSGAQARAAQQAMQSGLVAPSLLGQTGLGLIKYGLSGVE